MRPEILIPALMGCALLWWIGRGMSLTLRLAVAAVTLAITAAVLTFEKSMQ